MKNPIRFILPTSILALGIVGYAIVTTAKPSQTPTLNLKTVNASANYVTYNDLTSMENAADIIVIAKADKDFQLRSGKVIKNEQGFFQDFYTTTDLHIRKVIKGAEKISNKKISILEPAAVGLNGGEQVIFTKEDYIPTDKNKEYIVFLKSNNQGGYAIINMNEGKYEVEKINKKDFSSIKSNSGKNIAEQISAKYNLD